MTWLWTSIGGSLPFRVVCAVLFPLYWGTILVYCFRQIKAHGTINKRVRT